MFICICTTNNISGEVLLSSEPVVVVVVVKVIIKVIFISTILMIVVYIKGGNKQATYKQAFNKQITHLPASDTCAARRFLWYGQFPY